LVAIELFDLPDPAGIGHRVSGARLILGTPATSYLLQTFAWAGAILLVFVHFAVWRYWKAVERPIRPKGSFAVGEVCRRDCLRGGATAEPRPTLVRPGLWASSNSGVRTLAQLSGCAASRTRR
jgi:hypothetical protein